MSFPASLTYTVIKWLISSELSPSLRKLGVSTLDIEGDWSSIFFTRHDFSSITHLSVQISCSIQAHIRGVRRQENGLKYCQHEILLLNIIHNMHLSLVILHWFSSLVGWLHDYLYSMSISSFPRQLALYNSIIEMIL